MNRIDQLVVQLAHKVPGAAEELLAVLGGSMFGVAYSMVRNREDAKDLVQEAFVKILRNAHRFTPRGQGQAWVFQILRHTVLDFLGRRRIWINFESDEIDRPSGGSIDPIVSAQVSELEQAIADAILQLPWGDRELIGLMYYGGLSDKEVAKVLTVDIDVLWVRLCRARKRLRELLRKYL